MPATSSDNRHHGDAETGTPSVSIVIINFNYAPFLHAAIDSALEQTSPVAEVVVVDDGSTDTSRTIIASYGDRIVPVLKTAGGHVSAVNHGYSSASGDFCIFLDADDVLYPTCVESIRRIAQPGDAKIQYRLDTIDRHGIDQNMAFPYFPPDLTPEKIRNQSLRYGVYPWTVSSGNAFSRSFLDALLPIDSQEIYRSPDGYLNKMSPLFGNVRSTHEILGAYRVHGSNSWAQDGKRLRVEPIRRWLQFDEVLQRAFEDTAKTLGIHVCPAHRILTLTQAEHRLLAHRFETNEPVQRQSTSAGLFVQGIQAATVAPNINVSGRFFWMMWFFVLAFMPGAMVRFVFAVSRAQAGRTTWSRWVVRLSRGHA